MLAPTLATTDMSVDLRTTIGSPRRSSVVVLVRPWVLVSIPMPLSGLGEAPGALDGRWQAARGSYVLVSSVASAARRLAGVIVNSRSCELGECTAM